MLKLENISKYYYSSSNVTCALRKINLELNVGEFVAITGESGSGKTTLLNVISGLDSYEDGEMYYGDKLTSYFDDEDWEKYRKEEIAFIFQNYNLIDSFTVLENVLVTYMIDGITIKEGKAKAKEILKLVGLDKDIHKKATKLSGGQKQRLAIARALAKETNIIVADEPTGNLDAENGRSILELLKKVSKNKLVIVVTHNQSEVEPFITRKIRLHDGEIVVDETLEKIEEKNKIEKPDNKTTFKQILSFSLFNFKAQPKRSFLLVLLMLVVSLSSFIFIGNFKTNIDDNKTKDLDDTIFVNFDDCRLLAKDVTGLPITDDMLQSAKIDKVVSVEKYDAITDMNYYRPTDYKMVYTGGLGEDPITGETWVIDTSSYVLTDNSHFLRSASCLTEDMLEAGRLPTGEFEMVVYSRDLSVLDTTELVMFRNDKNMGDDIWYEYNVKIVGILKEQTEQTYFSEDICRVMELTSHEVSVIIRYYYKYSYSPMAYQRTLNFNKIVIDPNLEGISMSFPKTQKESLLRGFFQDNNGDFRIDENRTAGDYDVDFSTDLEVTDIAMGVSRELFFQIYETRKNSNQFAVFIEDYAYTDEVRAGLAEKGFDTLSCYNASVGGYNVEKVIIRYVNLAVSLIALVVVNTLAVILGFSIMKVKKNDYVIFKMIGLSNKMCKKINYMEMLLYAVIPTIITTVLMVVVKNYVTITLISNLFKYIKFYDYIMVFVISLISMILLGRVFGRFITNNAKITVLKEE